MQQFKKQLGTINDNRDDDSTSYKPNNSIENHIYRQLHKQKSDILMADSQDPREIVKS